MTYRERREAKAERLRGWADKRDEKGTASVEKAKQIADMIPFGQPILMGHHSQRRHKQDIERINSGFDQGYGNMRKADEFRSRADGIEAAADNAIYSDDPDAIERLEARIAELEAERVAIKARPHASYELSNLSGNIKRNKDRLAHLKSVQEHGERPRWMAARFASQCAECDAPMAKGDQIAYFKIARRAICETCGKAQSA